MLFVFTLLLLMSTLQVCFGALLGYSLVTLSTKVPFQSNQEVGMIQVNQTLAVRNFNLEGGMERLRKITSCLLSESTMLTWPLSLLSLVIKLGFPFHELMRRMEISFLA